MMGQPIIPPLLFVRLIRHCHFVGVFFPEKNRPNQSAISLYLVRSTVGRISLVAFVVLRQSVVLRVRSLSGDPEISTDTETARRG